MNKKDEVRICLKKTVGMYFSGKIEQSLVTCRDLLGNYQNQEDILVDVHYIYGVLLHLENKNAEARDEIEKSMRIIGIRPAFKSNTFELTDASPSLPLFSYAESRSVFDYYNNLRASVHGGYVVYFTDDLRGGGDSIGQDFKLYLHEKYTSNGKRFSRAHEAFSGPGFIGYSLLGHQICESIVFSDINQKAIDACHFTAIQNKIEEKVTLFKSDCLESIPENERWDLIVANPPHISVDVQKKNKITYLDKDFYAHRKFFSKLESYVTADSVIIFQESKNHSKPDDFKGMIEEYGFYIENIFVCRSAIDYYYIEIKKSR